jgi:thiosulfate reductase cytochrome b subunit
MSTTAGGPTGDADAMQLEPAATKLATMTSLAMRVIWPSCSFERSRTEILQLAKTSRRSNGLYGSGRGSAASISPDVVRFLVAMQVHSYSVRICHWINVIACAYLLVSGVHILLDFPELYWGNTGYRGYPAWFRLADVGLSWEEAGKLGDRRWGRNYHVTFAWVFLLNGLVYVGWNLYTTHFRRRMVPGRDELTTTNLRSQLRDHLPWRSRRHTSSGTYGTLQKLSYLSLIFVFTPFMILTGVAQSPGYTAAMPVLLDLFGGRQSARTLHTIGTVLLVLFVIIHLLEILAAGFITRVRSMITGHEPAAAAREISQ